MAIIHQQSDDRFHDDRNFCTIVHYTEKNYGEWRFCKNMQAALINIHWINSIKNTAELSAPTSVIIVLALSIKRIANRKQGILQYIQPTNYSGMAAATEAAS